MPITLSVTFMDKGPPKVRPLNSTPIDVEPEDKAIILKIDGLLGSIFQTDDQWFQNYIKNHLSWAIGKSFRVAAHGSSITVTWD